MLKAIQLRLCKLSLKQENHFPIVALFSLIVKASSFIFLYDFKYVKLSFNRIDHSLGKQFLSGVRLENWGCSGPIFLLIRSSTFSGKKKLKIMKDKINKRSLNN
ncbi:hypothetical protein RHMOL_Rhmol02G0051400 [Rhododendron molle]|uniref:Uncharacterized protein n=1 Tax=Rhododendron molle TaxID=49168 RepID=A0ACC0PLT9_RHOML|nr:hypothetical protein RHMOL_Rhmol02G0051400 [Rhododendron molle]